MPAVTSNHLTITGVARQLGIAMCRVRYAVDRFQLTPSVRIGIVRLWSPADVEEIRKALLKIDGRPRRHTAQDAK